MTLTPLIRQSDQQEQEKQSTISTFWRILTTDFEISQECESKTSDRNRSTNHHRNHANCLLHHRASPDTIGTSDKTAMPSFSFPSIDAQYHSSDRGYAGYAAKSIAPTPLIVIVIVH
jgi:hypothetical protein